MSYVAITEMKLPMSWQHVYRMNAIITLLFWHTSDVCKLQHVFMNTNEYGKTWFYLKNVSFQNLSSKQLLDTIVVWIQIIFPGTQRTKFWGNLQSKFQHFEWLKMIMYQFGVFQSMVI